MPPSSTLPSDGARQVWDQRFRAVRDRGGSTSAEPWLERWQPLFTPGIRVLDLGCGAGGDTRWLAAAGCRVTAADFSPQAVLAAREACSAAESAASFTRLDLSQGLPFAPGAFQVVVANLSLHYFPWAQTLDIAAQIRVCLAPGGALAPGGVLLARFNSTRDTSFGVETAPQVEPNAFNVGGLYKRYFDRPALEALFAHPWRLLFLEELTTHRYGQPKTLWEAAALRE